VLGSNKSISYQWYLKGQGVFEAIRFTWIKQSKKEGKVIRKSKLLIRLKNSERKDKKLHRCHSQYNSSSPSLMIIFSNLNL